MLERADEIIARYNNNLVWLQHRGECREDYEEAAKLRDLLREAQMADPIVQLKLALKNSIDEEDYEV